MSNEVNLETLNTPEMVTINLGKHQVPVIKNGLYHKYQTNTPLSVAAEIPGVENVSWFKQWERQKLDIDFTSYTPNLYYDSGMIAAAFTADWKRLRELVQVKEVAPIKVFPGRGVVAITAYDYRICDNDPYREIAISVLITKPNEKNLGPITLAKNSLKRENWAHVLELPLDSEVGRVRGMEIYSLPKWFAEIPFSENSNTVSASLHNEKTGEAEISLVGKNLASQAKVGKPITNNMLNYGKDGQLLHGSATINPIKQGVSFDPNAASLMLGKGRVADLLRSMDLGRLIMYQHIPQFQMALHASKPVIGAL